MCSTKVVLMLEPKKCVVHADAASQLQRPQQLLASRRFELSSYFERVRGHFSPLSQLTAKVSGPQNAGPLDRRVRPEGQKGRPDLKTGTTHEKALGHGSGAALQEG